MFGVEFDPVVNTIELCKASCSFKVNINIYNFPFLIIGHWDVVHYWIIIDIEFDFPVFLPIVKYWWQIGQNFQVEIILPAFSSTVV